MNRARPYGCREALAHLAAYLDEQVRRSARRKVEHHLKQCQGCTAHVEFERQVKSRLRAVGIGTVRASFQKRITRFLQGL